MNNKEKLLDVLFMIITSLIVSSFCYGLTSFILWESDPSKWERSYRFFNVVLCCAFAFRVFGEVKKNR